MTFPRFILDRDGDTITITAVNRDGKPLRIWKSDQYNEEIEIIAEIDTDQFQESGVSGDVAYVIQYGEFSLSLKVVEDFPDATPPYMVIEPVGSTQLTGSSYFIHPSWENDPIEVLTTIIDPLNYGMKSTRKYTRQRQ